MFRRYRASRDSVNPYKWAVQVWRWYFPFWIEYQTGLLASKEEAYELIDCLKDHR